MWMLVRALLLEPLCFVLLLGAGWLFDSVYAGLAAAVIVPVAIELAVRQYEKEKKLRNPPAPPASPGNRVRRKLPAGWT
jgi:hypothetical protein